MRLIIVIAHVKVAIMRRVPFCTSLLIGCDLVELIQLDRGIIMVVDEEGKLKEIKGGFTFLGWGEVIAGTGIVLGGNSSRLKALQENLASFEMMTEWVDAADVPPATAFVTAF